MKIFVIFCSNSTSTQERALKIYITETQTIDLLR